MVGPSQEDFTRLIRVKRLRPDAQMPKYDYPDDSGAGVFAAEACLLQPLERKAVPTGISVEVPPGFEIQVRPRSGLALEHGLTVLNTPGTVDAGYRGEIKVILINLGSEPYQVEEGQKIAQLVLVPVIHAQFEEVDQLSDSKRGPRGFGSTGVS